MIAIEFPMVLPSVSNLREHWSQRAMRVKRQRAATWAALLGLSGPMPASVTLVRIAPRKLDDDNLRGALKAVRDQVAAHFDIDDADPRLEWKYLQAKGPAMVRIEFETGVRTGGLRADPARGDTNAPKTDHGPQTQPKRELRAK